MRDDRPALCRIVPSLESALTITQMRVLSGHLGTQQHEATCVHSDHTGAERHCKVEEALKHLVQSAGISSAEEDVDMGEASLRSTLQTNHASILYRGGRQW